jgi:hypothetical protein
MMQSEINKIKSTIKDNVNVQLFKEPFTVFNTYGKDNGSIRYNQSGKDPICAHLNQDVNYEGFNIEYRFNEFGLRGPSLQNKDKKIIFAGGSFCFGTGVNVEKTFPYIISQKLNADYLNISDVDSISELITILKDIKEKFKPDYFILSDTRFISEIGWLRLYILDRFPKENEKKLGWEAIADNTILSNNDIRRFAQHLFEKTDDDTLLMFESFCKELFDIPMIFVYFNRKNFANKSFNFKYFQQIKMEAKDVIDMSRDNNHPGPLTHQIVADKILKLL